MKNIEIMIEDGTMDLLPKKEQAKLMKEKAELDANFGGIREMTSLPSAMFVVDPRKEANAIHEAKILGIPVVAIVDTNCDPDDADYVIPGNDDAIRAVKLLAGTMANAVIEANHGEAFDEEPVEEPVEEIQEAAAEETAEAVETAEA